MDCVGGKHNPLSLRDSHAWSEGLCVEHCEERGTAPSWGFRGLVSDAASALRRAPASVRRAAPAQGCACVMRGARLRLRGCACVGAGACAGAWESRTHPPGGVNRRLIFGRRRRAYIHISINPFALVKLLIMLVLGRLLRSK